MNPPNDRGSTGRRWPTLTPSLPHPDEARARSPSGITGSEAQGEGFEPSVDRITAHVLVPPDADCHARRAELELLLAERFGLDHTTLQVEHESTGGLLDITPGR